MNYTALCKIAKERDDVSS